MMRYLSNVKRRMVNKRRRKEKQAWAEAVQAGHFYSVIPDLEDVIRRRETLFGHEDDLAGVELNLPNQMALLDDLRRQHDERPLELSAGKRYDVENGSFSYDDGPVLHYLLRHLKPKRIIEIGCGYSSAIMLDTDELYLDNNINFTFIDINLDNLKSGLHEDDRSRITMIEQPVQTVDLSIFSRLDSGDLLFVDSSHVSKIGSDLNHILFRILPRLKKGVFVHFHDVRYPFEYDESLIKNKVFWNEAYILRSFLQFNSRFEICFWLNALLKQKDCDADHFGFLPLDGWDRRFGSGNGDFSQAGGSIYIRRM